MDLSFGIEKVPVMCIADVSDSLPQFKYVKENIPGPGSKIDDFQYGYCGCHCLDKCLTDCSCIQNYDCNYNEEQCLLVETYGSYDKPVMECNSQCSCGKYCPNRVVQQGLQLSLQVFKTDNKGWGVRTLNSINKFKFVCEYAGEVLCREEANLRFSSLQDSDSNYIIVVTEHLGNEKKIETIIDPTHYGNIGRFINHSCDPNLMMVPVRTDCIIPKLCLFSSRDITPFEELCYDYSGKNFSKHFESRENQSYRFNDKCIKKCMCGSFSCKKVLPYDPFLLK